jgi:hypothetical protein
VVDNRLEFTTIHENIMKNKDLLSATVESTEKKVHIYLLICMYVYICICMYVYI